MIGELRDGAVTRVYIGIASRDRPKMVSELLDSVARLDTDANLELAIILVENGNGEVLRQAAERFATNCTGIKIHHLVEPRLGIVFARNAALEFATNSDFDGLAFVDDDEVVTPSWILELVAEQQRGQYDIVGGPVRAFVDPHPLTFWNRIVWKGLSSRVQQVEQTCGERKANGQESQIVLSTNNWLVSLPFVRKEKLRFDERFNLTGGEDTRFLRDAWRLGAKTGWAHKAVVREQIVRERLSPWYQIRRARDHALVSLNDKSDRRPATKWLRAPVSAIFKLLTGLVLLLLAPFTGGATFFNALRALGEATGRAQGLLGIKSKHYRLTMGK
ncbi:glycosyltransferase family 2 protein [Mesorhizobium australicum]|uniref:Glycosyltransferase family 2 protein n=1 Tax=Mesorhizobium australicum TaxID=536018 RepID=A0ACC6T952_9HYPH|nr:glycosyltransferase family 2 protein [Mesorhizobium sp. LNHC229A00]